MSDFNQNTINDFNLNVIVNNDPRLEGYVPLDFFKKIDTDHSSRRIRDEALDIDHFYDYNLEDGCDCEDPND